MVNAFQRGNHESSELSKTTHFRVLQIKGIKQIKMYSRIITKWEGKNSGRLRFFGFPAPTSQDKPWTSLWEGADLEPSNTSGHWVNWVQWRSQSGVYGEGQGLLTEVENVVATDW